MKLHGKKLSATGKVTQHSPVLYTAEHSMRNQSITLPLTIVKQTNMPISEVSKLVRGLASESLKNKRPSGNVLYKSHLIYFNPKNEYLVDPEQLWQIESIIGTQALTKELSIRQTVNNQFIENLFKKASFSFYLNSDETYLLSSDDELTRLDFGPLTKVSALAALQRFGVVALERAKEKTAVRL